MKFFKGEIYGNQAAGAGNVPAPIINAPQPEKLSRAVNAAD
jgi:hypothetical protein